MLDLTVTGQLILVGFQKISESHWPNALLPALVEHLEYWELEDLVGALLAEYEQRRNGAVGKKLTRTEEEE